MSVLKDEADKLLLPKLRSSERNAFMRCPQMWYWGYVEKLTPRSPKFQDAAEFGTGIHLALENYYRPGTVRGPHPADTYDDWAKDMVRSIKTQEVVNDEQINKWEDFHELGVELMEEYVMRYGGDEHWDVLDAERKFSVVIPDVRYKPIRSEQGRRGYRPIVNFVGVFDLCLRDLNDGKIKMVDHKTAAAIRTEHLTLDTQASGYIAVATHALREQGLIGQDESVKGIEYNFIRKGHAYKAPLKDDYLDALVKAGGNRDLLKKVLKASLAEMCEDKGIKVYGEPTDNPLFMRHFVGRTPKERQRTIVRISEEARLMNDLRTGKLPILKATQKDCYFCPFFDLCELDEAGGDATYFKETVYKTHDPYGDHDEKSVRNGAITGM
jgi:CRISPR/Cas system-associated exonuclease Cas4 (RecB family)